MSDIIRGYRCRATFRAGGDTSKQKENEWVTVDALAVLQAAGRLRLVN